MPAENMRIPATRPSILPAMLLLAAVATALPGPCRAACTCICVGGQNRPLCSEVTDIEPLCPPKVCLKAPQSTRPLEPPTPPPSAAPDCRMEFVYNRHSGRYEWRRFCQ